MWCKVILSTWSNTCGLYYKLVTIVNYESSVISKWSFKLIDDASVVIYDCNMFIIQAIHLWLGLSKYDDCKWRSSWVMLAQWIFSVSIIDDSSNVYKSCKLKEFMKWLNEILMKVQDDNMASWWNGKLMKWRVELMAIWQNGELSKWPIDIMANWWNDNLTKW